jgi:ATP-dependent Clp protease ATP-binding subunit ClpA
MAGAYQGASEGSALLNNFVLLGIVLLDEIEKADQEIIHGL